MYLFNLSSFPLLSLLLSLLSLASASSLTITIPSSSALPNPNTLPASSHATLTTLSTGPEQSTPLKARLSRSLTFVFPDLPQPQQGSAKSYLLDIHSRDHVFAPYRVDVAADGNVIGVWETLRGHQWENKGLEKAVGAAAGGDVVVEARVLGKRGFYEERPKFNPMSLFANPMILLGIVALAVTFGMPYLLDNMDPEMREEYERRKSQGPLPQGGGGAPALPGSGFDLAGWMAGTTASSADAGAGSAGSGGATTSGREGGQQVRRR